MDEAMGLEVRALEAAVEAGSTVKIIFMNGYQTKAVIKDFDWSVILVEVNGRKRMIYRHAISTIDLEGC